MGGVLPPFSADVFDGEVRSPYQATLAELVDRFGFSSERCTILDGLIRMRSNLRALGIDQGLQWIDGSFVENCEGVRGRPPSDVDVVTLMRRPAPFAVDAQWDAFLAGNANVFDSQWNKLQYQCDAYFIDLDTDPELLASDVTYWSGFFSHQRETFRWKGMVEIRLDCDDEAALGVLRARAETW